MRTTLNIDDELYRHVKAVAALRGVSVTSVVEESLRTLLRVGDEVGAVAPLPVSAASGGLTDEFIASGVDLDDFSAVLEYLDEVRP